METANLHQTMLNLNTLDSCGLTLLQFNVVLPSTWYKVNALCRLQLVVDQQPKYCLFAV